MINVIYLSFSCYNTFNCNLKLNLRILVSKFVAVFPFDCWSTQVVESYSFSCSSTSNVSNNRIFCQVSVWLFVPCFENQQSSKHFQRKHFFHSTTKNGFYYVDTHTQTHTHEHNYPHVRQLIMLYCSSISTLKTVDTVIPCDLI